ncbi:hypothetical protein AQJ91_47215 [Streptomyces dysideae]|uniref:Prepilin type IV endopeptidase peptidase domain-containing protein n=1 Tax=Streptomyces dysideae TaxID=909626 RepID=A0A101UP96_9ACTN|nr:hypothetical protein AQJ91_47215 [Streptomyces dysideae]
MLPEEPWRTTCPAGHPFGGIAATEPRPEPGIWLPLAAITVPLLGVAELLPDAGGSSTTVVLGSLALGASYLVLFLINPKGFGFGDMKLALAPGAVLG